jgi:hypothetical protein
LRTRRDRPKRSLLQIRRLTYRATRSKAALEVLQDVLWETFPTEYEHAINYANELTRNHPNEKYQVVFISELLPHVIWEPRSYGHTRFSRPRDLFLVTGAWLSIRHEYPSGVVVYSTKPTESAERDKRRARRPPTTFRKRHARHRRRRRR